MNLRAEPLKARGQAAQQLELRSPLGSQTQALGLITGTSGKDTLVGSEGDDEIRGLGGDDSMRGGRGNDLIFAGPGNDTIHGGAGQDIAVFSGNSTNYRFSADFQGGWVVEDLRAGPGNSGTDLLFAVETMRFADRDMTVPFGGLTAATSMITTDIYQWSMDTAPLSDGGFVMTWSSRTSPGPLYQQVWMRTFDAQGQPTGPQTVVASLGTGLQMGGEYAAPSVTGLANGGYLVTWGSPLSSGPTYSIHARIYDAQGVASGEAFQVGAPAGWSSTYADATTLSDGSVVIAWEARETDLAGYDQAKVLSRHYDAAGNPLGDIVDVSNGFAVGRGIFPAITSLEGGGYVVIWHEMPGSGTGYDIVGQVFDASDNSQGGLFRLNATTARDQKLPDVAGLPGGGFIATWESGAAGNQDIYARVFDSDGVAQGAEFRVNTRSKVGMFSAAVATLATGDVMITWTAANVVKPGETRGQLLDMNGTLLGGEFTLMAGGIPGAGYARIAALGSGDFTLAALAGANGLYMRRFDSDGTPYTRILTGTADDDRIDIAGASYAEIGAAGSAGDDTYVVNSTTGLLIERVNEGTDTVETFGWWTLGPNFENLLIREGPSYVVAIGNALPNRITGNSGTNILAGLGGADTLDGGAGIDTATYDAAPSAVKVDLSLTTAQATSGAGLDTLLNIENLIGSPFSDHLSGNDGANSLEGGAGADTLAGGKGADTLDGGEGEDIAVFAGDLAHFRFGGSALQTLVTDTRETSAYQRSDQLQGIEILRFSDRDLGIDHSGEQLRLIATALDDRIDISSAGGITAVGGAGNDIYVVDDAHDVTQEKASEGIDTVEVQPVFSLLPDTLRAWTLAANIEHLTLLGNIDFDATGNALANHITGNVANNRLEGLGGRDTLDGGAGIDTAVYSRAGSGVRVDLGIVGEQSTVGAGRDTLLRIENIEGSTYADELRGDAGANGLVGGAGDDTLLGGAGDDWLSGGTGLDTARFAGSAVDYRLGWSAQNAELIVSSSAGEGVDRLSQVEALGFDDGALTLLAAGRNLVSTTTEYDRAPAIASLESGGYVLAWVESDGDSVGVFAQRLDGFGAAVGGSFRVNVAIAGQQADVSIAGLEGGGFVVGWTSVSSLADRGTYLRLFDTDGQPVTGERRVAAKVYGPPELVATPGGGFVLVQPGDEIRFRHYDAAGAPVGAESKFISAQPAHAPDAAQFADGHFIITWYTDFDDHGGDGDVFALHVNADGTARGAPVIVSGAADNNQRAPAGAVLADGGYVLSWQSLYRDGNGYGIYARIFDADGSPRGAEFRVNTVTEDNQIHPDVVALANGGFLVSWESDYQPGHTLYPPVFTVLMRRYDADGKAQGGETRLAGDRAVHPVLASADDGFVLAWSGAGTNVQRFDAAGQAFVPTVLGGTGADWIDISGDGDLAARGGAGNDVYVVNSRGDLVFEAPGEGRDRIESLLDWTLGAGFEDLVLRDGDSALKGIGNALGNNLLGNSGANILKGLGGADTLEGGTGDDVLSGGPGNDLLTGGEGADHFLFDAKLAANNVDTITDFSRGSDRIVLDDTIFKAFDAGVSTTLRFAHFYKGAGVNKAHDADDRIIYNTTTGALYYDPDGIGGDAAIQFATLGTTTPAALQANDFLVVT